MSDQKKPQIKLPTNLEESQKGYFHLYQADNALANRLRITIMDEVPTMAINVVKVMENESLLPDELIIQRLGLIPLVSHTYDNYFFPEECPCSTDLSTSSQSTLFSRSEFSSVNMNEDSVCSKCSAKINLIISGHDLNERQTRYITSWDLQSETEIQPVSLKIKDEEVSLPILPILPEQNLHFECYATKGRGKDHNKWSPVCKVVYFPTREGFRFELETVGSLKIEEIVKSAVKIMANPGKISPKPRIDFYSLPSNDPVEICILHN